MDTDTRAPLAPEKASTASKQNSASKRPPNKPEAAGVASRSAARRGLTARQQACVAPDKPDAGARASVAAGNAASVERASITPGVSADCGSASPAPRASADRNSASAARAVQSGRGESLMGQSALIDLDGASAASRALADRDSASAARAVPSGRGESLTAQSALIDRSSASAAPGESTDRDSASAARAVPSGRGKSLMGQSVLIDLEGASAAPGESAGRNSASATPVSSEMRQPMSIAQAEAAASPQMVEAEASAAPASPAPAFVPRPGQAVRMCVCGASNPESARFCYRCGQDIADVMPTAYSGDAPETADAVAADAVNESAAEAFGGALLRLCSLDGLCALDVSESCVLGRGAVLAEYLADKPYVSRRQAYLTLENGRVYIVHGGGRNPTCLNNRPLREGAPEELHPGDEIALGGMTIDGERQTMAAYFVVRRTGDSAEC